MPKIDGAAVRRRREELQLTKAELAERANVSQKTISRIEAGTMKARPREETRNALAAALNLTVEQLCGSARPVESDDDEPYSPVGSRSQVNVRIHDGARNAMSLVCSRYGLKPYQVVELAPLLFLWAAEKSLARRKARLNELWQVKDACEKLGTNFPHLHARLWVDDVLAEEIYFAELESIQSKDIFAHEVGVEYESPSDNNLESNPFSVFLHDLTQEISEFAEFHWWPSRLASPVYRFTPSMIPSSITDDIDLRKDIGAGSAPLREIPKEMRDPAARTVFLKDWVQKRAAEATKFIDDFFVPPSTTVTGDLP